MGQKRENLYSVIKLGLQNELNDEDLYQEMKRSTEKLTDRRIVRASVLGFSDPDLNTPQTIERLTSLIVKYRLQDLGAVTPATVEAISLPETVDEPEEKQAEVVAPVPARRRKVSGTGSSRKGRVGLVKDAS